MALVLLPLSAPLILVAVETRNSTKSTKLNTQALEIAAYQELINNISEINVLSLQSRDAAEIILKMRDSEPPRLESARLNSAFFMLFRHGDIAYFMYERGAIDESRLRSALKLLPLSGESSRYFWAESKDNFVSEYQQYIDRPLLDGFWDQICASRLEEWLLVAIGRDTRLHIGNNAKGNSREKPPFIFRAVDSLPRLRSSEPGIILTRRE
jgi:hypothetical protein